ncbi:hypothetical protein RchiOBHm_Chr2g0156711 [Rosa chinensis]|uniref:Uncharacterized protein n=1 Tax=Rosa chinensis TaxID=74649 RepID=A0A2P6S1J7_ROSCH|nr:hypothetical protein RchiOBHm_Chr2g0156711 [Rosa chinensis]
MNVRLVPSETRVLSQKLVPLLRENKGGFRRRLSWTIQVHQKSVSIEEN